MNTSSTPSRKPEWLRGPLAWLAANPVAANLLMLVLLIGGWIIGSGVKQEVFPEFDADIVTIDIAYPGASPEEVEQGVILASEDAVRGIDGVKTVESSSYEGAGVVVAEVVSGYDPDALATDVERVVAGLGIGGCAFEQPLEAALKAVSPSSRPTRCAMAMATPSHFASTSSIALPISSIVSALISAQKIS